MKTFQILVLIFLSMLAQLLPCAWNQKLSCELKWVTVSSGGKLPAGSVEAHDKKNYVARIKVGSNFVAGYVDISKERAFAVAGNKETVQSAFEVLTNPYDCLLAWVTSSHDDLSNNITLTVPPYVGSPNYIGRAPSKTTNKTLFSGEINYGSKKLTITANGQVQPIEEGDYYVLTSTSDGVVLSLTQFVFNNDPLVGEDDMMGIEKIYNNSPAEILQTVTHRKNISESVNFKSTTNIFEVAKGIKIAAGLGVGIPGFGISFGISASLQISNSFTTVSQNSVRDEKSTVLEVSRVIRVPAFTNIHACSTMSMKRDFNTTWTSRAQFTCRGWSSDKLLNYIESQAEWKGKNWTEQGNSIITDVSGEFSGSFGMGSKFYVASVSEGSSGCVEAKKFLTNQKEAMATDRNFVFDADKQDAHIRSLMSGNY